MSTDLEPTETHQPTTDVALFDPAMARELYVYAENIAPAALLPVAYRNKPADILIAAQLGMAVGINPAQALQEIVVIQGRPTLSAKLIGALARRAGHKLRVEGDSQSCTATLIRKDDPDHPFVVTWTFEMAKNAKLTGKDVWQSFPADMLAARAISGVVKRGAAECLLGISMSSEEAYDMVVQGELVPSNARPVSKAKGLDALRAAVTAPRLDNKTRTEIADAFTRAGFTSDPATEDGRTDRFLYIAGVLASANGGEVTTIETTADLTPEQANTVLTALAADEADLTAEPDGTQ